MAKKTTTSRKPRSTSRKTSAPGKTPSTDGKNLVIVESPAKAKTINKYLGPDFVVLASVGHVRDLPAKNPKGVKDPVPGVDLDHDFQPTYEVIKGKNKTITELKKAARSASQVWLATDMDREGEAIAWHLAEALNLDPENAKRVVFNAITQSAIKAAFADPHHLDMDKVNAQQARRILDRIVGYQVSPLLWKKVAGGLSAGRVQSVAVRIVVEREREIQAFIPEEYWKITGAFTTVTNISDASALARQFTDWLASAPENPKNRRSNGRTQKEILAFLAHHQSFLTELVEINGQKFEPKNVDQALDAAQRAGFTLADKQVIEDPAAKGPAATRITLLGSTNPASLPWHVKSIQTRRTSSRPNPPFITSTLQQAAANRLGFSSSNTMRIAQQLYEGVNIRGRGSVGLITYMRTDSTHISGEALTMARQYIQSSFGPDYLPEKPNFYSSSNRAAQEAHEAIRPTDTDFPPADPAVKASLSAEQLKLYTLIWQRFIACQMTPAQWDSTAVLVSATAADTELVFKGNGRILVFDGFYKVVGIPDDSDEATLPPLTENQPLAPIQIDPRQQFTSPPPRYTEASLVRKLEAEGIGRPSTYASIVQVIVNRKYVEKISNRFHATDLGMVVTDKLTEGFPKILDIGYTREMESHLDAVEEQHHDWVQMLHDFYGPFRKNLEKAHEDMTHARAETQPAPDEYRCPDCGAPTVYRFGRNGRFLSCSRYPDCKYAAPVDREGKPQSPEATDIACPICSKPMLLKKGRFGPFLSCTDYPECKGIVNLDKKGHVKPPSVPPLTTDLPCPKCGSPVNIRRSKRGPWLSCSTFPKCRGRVAWSSLEPDVQKKWEAALEQHEAQNPQPVIKTTAGRPIGDEHKPAISGQDNPGSPDDNLDSDAA